MYKLINCLEEIKFNSKEGIIQLAGYAFFDKIELINDKDIKKSLFILKENKKYYIPLENIERQDISDVLGEKKYNYNFCGFSGIIDISYIDDMSPLDEGCWSLGIYINCSGFEAECILNSNRMLDHEILKLPSVYFSKQKRLISIENKHNKIFIKSRCQDKTPINAICCNSINHLIGEEKSKEYIVSMVLLAIYKILKLFRVKNNRVVFLSDSRIDFTGNFEFIYKELQQRGGYEIKSLLKPSISAKKSIKEKLKFLLYISTSKYILLDDYYPQIYKYKIKDEIEVIQLWHATGAFKTFGFSRLGKTGGPNVRSKNHRNYTKAIVSSSRIKKHYAEAFGISEDKVVATGVPRTDIFFDETYKEKKIKELYEKYPILKEKKVIMFAPTFRGNGQKTAHYDFDQLDLELMYEQLSQEYVIIMKLHPFIKNIPVWDSKYQDFIVDLSHEREINDLLFISDLLITDYSSVCFEYALLNRPMIFFAYDLEEYIASRDFYYPYESFVPGPIVKTSQELVEIIKTENYNKEKLNQFRTKFFDHLDGKSTKRVVDMLLKLEK